MGCTVHRQHQDEPESLDSHHIVPESWGGSGKASNRALLCPSGHRDLHVFLDILVMGQGTVPSWAKVSHWNRATRALAQKGYDNAIAQGLTPKPTL